MLEDTMQNRWGVTYITYTEKRCGRRTFSAFKQDISKEIPGFQLYSVQMCGTDANAVAISLVTNYDYSRCLFGIGSYIGGDECHQNLSSSGYQGRIGLALPKEFEEASPQCKLQTIPLPYHVPSKLYSTDSLRVYENRCLVHLHQRLFYAELTGAPIKAILLEYVLGGNGGELTLEFLKKLGRLLKYFNVSVIADEILTGGRTGKSVVLTSEMPPEFVERIECITMGKFVGCGLVLCREERECSLEVLRGFSTQADCALPSKLWTEVVQRIKNGMIEERRAKVLKLMNCVGPSKEEDHWGRGLQIYTSYSRGSVLQGLRNRCLPRLEKSKLIKSSVTRTQWTRLTVCNALVETSDEWILRQQSDMVTGQHSFVAALIAYIFNRVSNNRDGQNDDYIHFRSDDVSQFLGKRGDVLANEHNNWQRTHKGKKTNAKASSLVKRAIADSITNTHQSRIIYKKRIGYSRQETVVFDTSSFNVYA